MCYDGGELPHYIGELASQARRIGDHRERSNAHCSIYGAEWSRTLHLQLHDVSCKAIGAYRFVHGMHWRPALRPERESASMVMPS